MKLTQDFDDSEFTCKCACGKNNISITLVNRLQVLRDIINEPIFITSGCRCVKHNSKIPGSAPNSNHLIGLAIDFTMSNPEHLLKLNSLIEKGWSGGFHFYKTKNFIHIDIGHKSRWATD